MSFLRENYEKILQMKEIVQDNYDNYENLKVL